LGGWTSPLRGLTIGGTSDRREEHLMATQHNLMATRHSSAVWTGDIAGRGELTVGNEAFIAPYSFGSRFEEGAEGTSPEELIAAGHAACLAMALSNMLAAAGYTPQQVHASARSQMELDRDGAPTITRMALRADAEVRGIDDATFQRMAEEAKETCPVSRALAGIPEVTIDARLV
jgi:osmotically inducible protein OsmC